MKTIGIFYGSSTGTTESVAKRIAQKLGVEAAHLYDVAKASPADMASYEVLILGSSTWGAGDLQDDWYDFLAKIKKLDLTGKTVLVVGSGISGVAATELLKKKNVNVVLFDGNKELDLTALREKHPVFADVKIILGELTAERIFRWLRI